MRKNVLTIMVLLISGTILAQNGGTFMKKYENQLPQSGYRIRFAQSRHQIDAGKSKHIYRTAIEIPATLLDLPCIEHSWRTPTQTAFHCTEIM